MKINIRKIDSSGFLLILANCVPLIGVLFFDWNLFSLLIGYWLETGIIGIFTFIKSIYVYKITSKTIFLINGFNTLFLCGSFMLGHLIAIMGLFSLIPNGDGQTGLKLFNQSSAQILNMLITLSISHGYSFFYNFIGKDEKTSIIRSSEKIGINSSKVRNIITGDLIVRIFLTQFIVIAGAFILGSTKTTIHLSIFFIVIKTIVDLILHIKRHSDYKIFIQKNNYHQDLKMS